MSAKRLVKSSLRPFNIVVPHRINGVTFKVPITKGMGARNLRTWETWMTDCLRRLFAVAEGSAVMDVGVNLGQTLLKVKSLSRSAGYLGFEPNAACVAYVQELIRVNEFANCELVAAGLSDKSDLVEFVASNEFATDASIVTDLRPDKLATRVQHVPVVRFDAVASAFDRFQLGIVKIDVEGAELEAVSGMKAFLGERRPLVLCEVLHAHSEDRIPMLRTRNGQLRAILQDVEYEPHRVLKDGAASCVTGLEHIDAFDEAVFDPGSSEALCDYLFVPRETLPRIEASLG